MVAVAGRENGGYWKWLLWEMMLVVRLFKLVDDGGFCNRYKLK